MSGFIYSEESIKMHWIMLWRTFRIWEWVTSRVIVFCSFHIYPTHVSIPEISVGYHSRDPHSVLKIEVHISYNFKKSLFLRIYFWGCMSLLWIRGPELKLQLHLGNSVMYIKHRFKVYFKVFNSETAKNCLPSHGMLRNKKKNLKFCLRVSVIVLVPWWWQLP